MAKKKPKVKKPEKRSDQKLFELIEKSIKNEDYIFLPHAKARLKERSISDLVVLDILEGRKGSKRKRNKAKDSFKSSEEDWSYCIEGVNPDNARIRIILTFNEKLMPIITVMWVGKE